MCAWLFALANIGRCARLLIRWLCSCCHPPPAPAEAQRGAPLEQLLLPPPPAPEQPTATAKLRLGPIWHTRDAECELTFRAAADSDAEGPPLSRGGAATITVQQLLYQFRDAVRVMRVSVDQQGQGEPWLACLKLRAGAAAADVERGVYARMRGTPVERLFLRLHFFCTVEMPDGSLWSGYCMELGDFGASHLMSVNVSAVAKRSYFALHLEGCGEAGGAGEPVQVHAWPTVQDAVAVACLRLLCRIHAEGWIHGDSHGGNFMCVAGRMYAIDFERAFPTADPVHHFLDVQELFGHATWVLLSRENPDRWDLHQCVAIYSRRHPYLARDERPALHMLPLCQCFACIDQQERVEGCDLCRSPANVRAAAEFAAGPDRFIEDAGVWGLNNMRSCLGRTRLACIRHCRALSRALHPCVQCPRISMQACMELLWHDVYAPAVSEEAARENRRLEDRLRSSGFAAQADLLRASTPATVALL